MADVKWIKLKVGMFDGSSFKRIKKAKIGGESFRDKLTAVWFELMDFAGKCNNAGALCQRTEIPFTDLNDVAIMIDREPEELQLCMAFFVNEGMIEIIDDVYLLTNWAQYQNEAGLDRIREQKRIAQAKWREKKRAALLSEKNFGGNTEKVDENSSTVDSTVDSTDHLPSISISNISNSYGSTKKDKGGMGGEENKVRHKYGQYANVLLTDEDLEKLKNEFPDDWKDRIERLSEYMASTGKSYKSHLATIRNWARRDAEKRKKESAAPDYGDPEDFYK